jgi:1-acyl-sn-glycerol-3-phosphate acyltransferase
LCSVIVRLLVSPRVYGCRRLDGVEQPCVVVCNHLSWIDPLLMIHALGPGRPVVFLAAREHIESKPLLDRVVTFLGGVIKVDRGAMNQREMLRAAEAALAAGASLALFPEGRINRPEETGVPILPLEPGAAFIARRAGAPIVPMALAGSRELHFRRRVILAIGDPISPGATSREDTAVSERIRETLLALLPPTPPLGRVRLGRWLGRLA